MSFSFEVKEEIASLPIDNIKSKALLYGMLVFSKSFTEDKIVLQTENLLVAELFTRLIGEAVHNDNAVKASVIIKKNNISLYLLTVESQKDRTALCNYIYNNSINNNNIYNDIDLKIIGKKKNIPYFLSGAFLSCGSINDPNKEYHLEFVISSQSLCDELCDVISMYGICMKNAERKNLYILYLKESENIEDILTLMGATKSSLELMNVKIIKDVRNKTNRAVNCDSANIEKSLQASDKQIEDIKYIKKKRKYASMPQELIEIAELRLMNPDWNLREIGENLLPPISRSGANHRFSRISKFAKELRK